MRLIQPLKFRILKTGCFKMPRLQTPHLQMAVFQTGVTVASGSIHFLNTNQQFAPFNSVLNILLRLFSFQNFNFVPDRLLVIFGMYELYVIGESVDQTDFVHCFQN